MSIIKSLAVGNGDMYYILHGSDNFTIIDCSLSDENRKKIIAEVCKHAGSKGIVRFISTHPDQDHFSGLVDLDDALHLLNFYCVKNAATKQDETADFKRYCELRDDPKKAFYLSKGCSRRWMNQDSEERGSAGINILWPDTSNADFKAALAQAKESGSPNNVSAIIRYRLNGGVTALWLGDLETDFMEAIEDHVDLDAIDILFAPHHGRESGKVPTTWLERLTPKLVVIGEAPSDLLNYYSGYNTLTQNSAGDITFDCVSGKVHVYVSSKSYIVDFLDDEGQTNALGSYIGTLQV